MEYAKVDYMYKSILWDNDGDDCDDAGRIQVDVVTVQSTGFNKRQLLTWLY